MQLLEISTFLEKFAAGTHTDAEHQQFIQWLKIAPIAEVAAAMDQYCIAMDQNGVTAGETEAIITAQIEKAIDRYEMGRPDEYRKIKSLPWRRFTRIAAAVCFLFISGTAIWIYKKNSTSTTNSLPKPRARVSGNELFPGGNKATLTLSNGAVITLDDAKNGKIAQQGSSVVNKAANGQLIYTTLEAKHADIVFNTLTTPKGGQFKLRLPDGSEVWLNAASSIKYPTSFTGNERRVEISGEAYFEIAHNASNPFIVDVQGMKVKVVGTHFNINAYSDEAFIRTSLLEGIISLSKPGTGVTLLPGQQARLAAGEDIKVTNDVDMDEVVAWKNGYFSFNRADLQTVMRQIARWYDVDISYEGKVPERLFGGKIDRNSNASEVLKILEESKVHFTIKDKKIIVRP